MPNLLFYPDEAGELLHQHLEELENPDVSGIPIGVQEVDQYLLPLMNGDLGIVLARAGHMKSALMGHMTRIAAEMALNQTTEYGPPIYVSNEMPVEELALRNLSNYTNLDSKQIRLGKGKNNWHELHLNTDSMGTDYPIIYLANSLYDRSARGKITIEFVDRTVQEVSDRYGVRPRLVCIDYLQRMLTDGHNSDRRLMLSEVVEKAKDIALAYHIPVLMGSQAGRDVEQEKFPVPSTRSGKETGNIEETCDWMVAGMRPAKVWQVGDTVPGSKFNIIVTPDLFFLQVLKQRNGDAGKGFWLSFDPRITELSELEMKYQGNP